MTAWTVRDSNGQLLADFAAGSRLDVGRKLVPGHYDAFRLHVLLVLPRAVRPGLRADFGAEGLGDRANREAASRPACLFGAPGVALIASPAPFMPRAWP
jgi:hypothetical protein